MPAENNLSLWIVEPIGKHHNRADFSCGHETLDHYLKQQATQDARRRVAAPFILTRESDHKIIGGYYTLSASGIYLEDLPDEIVKKLPPYPMVPVTLLGRLAVDQRYRGQGIGEFLLMDALQRAFMQSSQIAAMAVVVDAIDDKAIDFYRHFGFIDFPDKPGKLFLPMKTIGSLFTST
ncbi:MAG: GNAT family N-acetyltransferase [Nitrospira sp.]|nr:GNAT family N-acetyltransferase [Nitrospira sp.]OQW36209.1 MAG: GCN5 family acetyltransferase [Nitrospira sp. SG-bin1]